MIKIFTGVMPEHRLLVCQGSKAGSKCHVAHERYHRCRFSNTQELNLENVEYYCGNF
jgi:hypothetical protein